MPTILWRASSSMTRLERQIQLVRQFEQNVPAVIAERQHVAARKSVDHVAFDSDVGAGQHR